MQYTYQPWPRIRTAFVRISSAVAVFRCFAKMTQKDDSMMRLLARPVVFLFSLCLLLLSGCGGETPSPAKAETNHPAVRRFRFDYGATLKGLPENAKVRVWIPVPPSDEHQKVIEVGRNLPAKGITSIEPKYGNHILYFETQAPKSGEIAFNVAWHVERKEVRGLKKPDGSPRPLTPRLRQKFLASNSKVPVGAKEPLELLADLDLPSDGLKLGEALYKKVDAHMKYDKSKSGWGNGDVCWACESGFGNCTDFHSLFISLARSKNLPARFQIGFPLPPERRQGEERTTLGYHCWAFFYAEDYGWVPVDISAADRRPEMKEYFFGNLTADRVAFTVGRDLELAPKQSGAPLNFFVYPYVEVDDTPLSKDQIENRFKFVDL